MADQKKSESSSSKDFKPVSLTAGSSKSSDTKADSSKTSAKSKSSDSSKSSSKSDSGDTKSSKKQDKPKSVWARARAILKEVEDLINDARKEGVAEVADAAKRAQREFLHNSFTDAEAEHHHE